MGLGLKLVWPNLMRVVVIVALFSSLGCGESKRATLPSSFQDTTYSPGAVGSITSLSLVDVDNGQKIISNFGFGTSVWIGALPSQNLTIVTNVSGSVGSVSFSLDGATPFVSNGNPFSLCGNLSTTPMVFLKCPSLDVGGHHTIAATAYSGVNASGTKLAVYATDFTIVTPSSTPVPTPTSTPTPRPVATATPTPTPTSTSTSTSTAAPTPTPSSVATPTPSPAPVVGTRHSYYVRAGGGGNCSGSDWNNAAGKIPVSLNPGDIVYLGGSSGNFASATNTPCAGERTHTFTASGTSSAHIQVVKCTSSISGCTSAAGWLSSYGSTSAIWNDSSAPVAGAPAFWAFCGNYYDVSGSYGSADQAGSYGISMHSSSNPNYIQIWPTNGCSGSPQTGYNFQYLEIGGDTPRSLYGVGGAQAFYLLGGTASATISDFSASNLFIHDIFEPFSLLNVNGFTLRDSWVYRNFCNSSAHSQGLQSQSVGLQPNNLSTSNLTIYNVIWRNIQGTGIVMCLSGQCNNWKIYNNLVWYDSNWNTANCSYGDSTASCAISKFTGDNGSGSTLTNSLIYGNTIAFAHNVAPLTSSAGSNAGVVITSSTSFGNVVENNLWYQDQEVDLYSDNAQTPLKVVTLAHDHNQVINSPSVWTTYNIHEFHSTNGTADPFVSSVTGNFHLLNSGLSAPTGCISGVSCLANGLPLGSPFNLDLNGVIRGDSYGWTIGTYQY